MRRRHTLCVATAKLSCDVDASRTTRALEETGGQQGQALLVTFAAIGTAKQRGDLCAQRVSRNKSDWPRAAIEREGGRRAGLAKNEFGWYQFEVG